MRSNILEAARYIFAGQGYQRFSIRRLAQELNCAVGTIYLHFKGKDDLVETLVDESFARLRQALNDLGERHRTADPVLLLKKAMYSSVDFGLRHPHEYRFAFLLRAPRPSEPDLVPPECRMFRAFVARCSDERRFRDVDIETASQALWAAIHGVLCLLIQRPGFPAEGRTKLIAEVINNAVEGLLAHMAQTGAAAGG